MEQLHQSISLLVTIQLPPQDDEMKLRTYGTAGHLHRITLENFMCHQHFSMVPSASCLLYAQHALPASLALHASPHISAH